MSKQTLNLIDTIYRTESRRILATLIRLVSDFDLAEESMQEAFAVALARWPQDGVPQNPRAWLISTGRFKAIDVLRRRARSDSHLSDLAQQMETDALAAPALDDDGVGDDRLRLIFTCCHPALPPDARIALTLREVCGLTTEEIAHGFLIPSTTLAQRIVRAKSKIRDARIPYQIPSRDDLPDRLEAVLRVVYLVFNEGYAASSGDSLTRSDLSGEAIRLGRLLTQLLPEPEAVGLLALMLLHESRRQARCTETGDLILLEDQDRTLWNQDLIAQGRGLVELAMAQDHHGPYAIQAAIAAVHATTQDSQETDWARIVALYDLLLQAEPSPVVELNRAVAVAMRDGPDAGVALIDGILASGRLTDYYLAHSARAELCRRLGKLSEARVSYLRALQLVRQVPEKRFLERKLSDLSA